MSSWTRMLKRLQCLLNRLCEFRLLLFCFRHQSLSSKACKWYHSDLFAEPPLWLCHGVYCAKSDLLLKQRRRDGHTRDVGVRVQLVGVEHYCWYGRHQEYCHDTIMT